MIQDHYQQLRKQYQAIADQGDMDMIDSMQAPVTHLDQQVQNLINCCNSKKEVIKVEFDNMQRDCEIFAQQVITNRILGTQILEGHDKQIEILDFVLKESRMGMDAIQDQSQQINAGAMEEFGKLKSRINGCEKEQMQMKIKQVSLTLTYNTLQKRITDLEVFKKPGLPN
jgi:hypothetical protein